MKSNQTLTMFHNSEIFNCSVLCNWHLQIYLYDNFEEVTAEKNVSTIPLGQAKWVTAKAGR